ARIREQALERLSQRLRSLLVVREQAHDRRRHDATHAVESLRREIEELFATAQRSGWRGFVGGRRVGALRPSNEAAERRLAPWFGRVRLDAPGSGQYKLLVLALRSDCKEGFNRCGGCGFRRRLEWTRQSV